jgi:hypothetical protein
MPVIETVPQLYQVQLVPHADGVHDVSHDAKARLTGKSTLTSISPKKVSRIIPQRFIFIFPIFKIAKDPKSPIQA